MGKQGVRYFKRCEYEIIYSLKDKYGIKFLCEIMSVNRSGYYKWKSRQGKPNRYEKDRILLTQLLETEHQKHPSHGYHLLLTMYLLKQAGFSLIIWRINVAKLQEFVLKQESTDIRSREKKV